MKRDIDLSMVTMMSFDQPRLLGKAAGDDSGLMGEAINVSRR